MRKLKILNLYCGIGGNRKLLEDNYEITAVENNPEIAKIYKEFFPKDKIVVGDAHEYLLKHFKEFDFIWSSPSCPTHSKARFIMASSENEEFKEKYNQFPKYPSMILYEEILFLQHYFKGKFVVENVIAFYKPLIAPQEIEKHWWWTNFFIVPIKTGINREHNGSIKTLEERKGFNLNKYKYINKGLALRNCVEPELGKYIIDCAMGNNKQKSLL